MQISSETRGDVLILRLSGRFTAGSEAEYQGAKQQIQSVMRRKVLLDFREVPYIDSTGLAYLVGMYHAVRGLRGRMVLSQGIPRVREILELTRLNRVFPMFATEEEGLAALAEWERMKETAMAV
jgi:anti-sigma B factor antagonist